METIQSIIKQKSERNKWIARLVLTIVLLVYMWAAFPGYGFHTWYHSNTHSGRSITTESLSNSVPATQYFTPVLPYLKSIRVAIKFNAEYMGTENVTFSLCDENNQVLVSRDIPIADMQSKRYYEVEIDKKLKMGKNYYWSLTSPVDSGYEWQIMYTEYPEDQAPENISFLLDNAPYGNAQAQTISEYTYYDHHDKVIIICSFWASGFFVYLIGLELINRIAKAMTKKVTPAAPL